MSKTTSTDSRKGTRRPTPTSRLPKPKQQVEEERPAAKRAAARKAAAEKAAAEKESKASGAKRETSAKGTKKNVPTKRAPEKSEVTGHTAARDAAEAKAERGTFISRLFANELRKRLIIGFALVVVVLAMLYAPARAYYLAWRTQLDLSARYEAIQAENDEINEDLDHLRSREGIEDEARKRGYVNPGETAVVVRGLPDEDIDGGSQADEVVAEVPWYLVPLDALFGYEGI